MSEISKKKKKEKAERKNERKKEREKEKPIRTCKPGYLEDHYPVPLHWFSVRHWQRLVPIKLS